MYFGQTPYNMIATFKLKQHFSNNSEKKIWSIVIPNIQIDCYCNFVATMNKLVAFANLKLKWVYFYSTFVDNS